MNVVAIVVSSIVLLGLLVIVVIYLSRRYWQDPLNLPKTLIADVNPEYISNIYVPDEWEVSRSDIELIKELGQGSFGMVSIEIIIFRITIFFSVIILLIFAGLRRKSKEFTENFDA